MSIRGVAVLTTVGLILPFTSVGHAQGMPKTVKQQLGKLVGEWTIESRIEGTTAQAKLTSRWSPHEDCIVWHWSGTDAVSGTESTMTGMLGWDGLKERVFERGFSADGQTFTASHNISEKAWRSPTKGTVLMDGTLKESKSLRVFEWKSDDVLVITQRNRELDGKAEADSVGTFTRVK